MEKIALTRSFILCSLHEMLKVLKSRRMRWVRQNFSSKIGRPRHRWKDIIMCLREMGYEDVDWIQLAQDRRDQWLALV
jgi:hypothetical protein